MRGYRPILTPPVDAFSTACRAGLAAGLVVPGGEVIAGGPASSLEVNPALTMKAGKTAYADGEH